jgi:hypothetical protein
MSTAVAAYQLRDLIERLDQARRTLEAADGEADEITLPFEDWAGIWRTLEDAVAFLHELQFENGGDAMSDSPTFVATFNDDETVRMTVF